jgi:hypothetical protein
LNEKLVDAFSVSKTRVTFSRPNGMNDAQWKGLCDIVISQYPGAAALSAQRDGEWLDIPLVSCSGR